MYEKLRNEVNVRIEQYTYSGTDGIRMNLRFPNSTIQEIVLSPTLTTKVCNY